MARSPDYVIVGAGINSLVCAALLGKAGKKVVVLEREAVAGGCMKTGEITAPGYVHDTMATTFVLFLTSPAFGKIGADLARHGLDFAHTPHPTAVLLPDGRSLVLTTDRAENVARFNTLAAGDGDRYRGEVETVERDAELVFGLLGWTTLARRVRSHILSQRNEDYVLSAEISGASPFRIISKHLLPSFTSYIVVDLAITFPYVLLSETALSFIGLGLRPPSISWGIMLQDAQNVRAIEQAPWLFIPALFVVLAVLAFTILGDGLRDAADPYQTAD